MSNKRPLGPLPRDEEGHAIMRVQMDEEQLVRMLQPILDEVNRLRKSVEHLERIVDSVWVNDGK